MVQRFVQSMYKEIRGLHQAAYILALFTFGSQLLALLRDRLLAHEFGASVSLDLYYAAFKIPDFFYVLFISTLSIYVLIPFISERVEQKSSARAQALLSQIFTLFLCVYSVIAVIVALCAPKIVTYFFPGLVAESETLVLLIRILLLQPLLLGFSSLYGVIVQLEHRFIIYAISPLLYNIGIIFGIVFLYPLLGIAGLAVGVVCGALAHLLVQLPIARKSPLYPRFTFAFSWNEIRDVCRVSFVRAITLSLHQCVLLGFVGFASIMTVGSVSVFQFAYNLQSVPLAIIGMSYSVAAFPLLSKLFAERKYVQFGEHIMTALRHILFWSIPAAILFIVVRAQFVRVVLGTGAFDWDDTRLTAAVLALFMISLTSQTVHLLLIRAFYAAGNTKIPLYTTLISSVVALLSALLLYMFIMKEGYIYSMLVELMRLEGVTGIEVLALPLGYSIALLVQTLCILVLGRRIIYIHARQLMLPLAQTITASLIAGVVTYSTLNFFVTFQSVTTLITIFLQGFFAASCGIGVYLITQWLFRNREVREMYRSFEKRFVKEGLTVPQEEDTLGV